jgi:SAM-dependent methyltransferase
MNVSCILCESSNTYKADEIDTQQLSVLYKKRAGTDVSRFFTEPFIYLYTCNDCGLKFYWPQAIGDGKFYDELQRYSGYYLEEKAEFKEAAKFIGPNDRVLEIGCGEGLFTNFIQPASYTGLEFSEDAIRKGRERGITIINESIEQHAAHHAEAYDAVCYFQVLEHVQHLGRFIRDSLRCLRPGGKLLVAVPSEDSFIKNVVNFYLNMPPHHASRWTDHSLQQVAAMYNLDVLQLFHEPLHGVHKRFYVKTAVYNKIMGKKRKPVDNSATATAAYAFAALLSYAAPVLLPAKEHITGQSVLVVYKKN